MPDKKEESVIGGLLSVTECAKKKGVTRQAIVSAIQRGTLPAQVVGKYYAIKPEDCDQYTPIKYPSNRAKKEVADTQESQEE